MNKIQAQSLIKDTFENPFDRARFNIFIMNLLNRIEDASFNYQGCYIPEAFSSSISNYERIGKYSDGQHRIDILVVKLKKEMSIERARTMQRNFIAGYLAGRYGSDVQKDAALVAFVSPSEVDWRFSLVKLDYRFEEGKKGRSRAVEEYTPARRWSFLVGKNEASHTAQSKLIPILIDDECPALARLEDAFNVEKVGKEFFEKYRDLFILTKAELDKIVKNDSKVRHDFESKGIDTVNFAKKLLGQIVFLYFLQKKGWFGVSRDADWGTGPKTFLRQLFEKKHGGYENYFNDILEPLFYESLARERDDDFYSKFNCKIPFLNGGLFDPISNYDWVHTDILLPTDLFSNKKATKEGDIGSGILDIFDRYNFTVKEDEPLDKEVAIDPEMLGKAYEKFNAIRPDNYDEYVTALKSGKKGVESKFNKQYGVYYTPREIVHYMCQQSLIQYLHSELSSAVIARERSERGNLIPSKEDIEILIKHGEHFRENEACVVSKGKETDTYPYKLPESIRKNAESIDDRLADIKVCDPAVGSGAFPVGMMTEIVKTRHVLSTYINTDEQKIDRLSHVIASETKQSRTIYNLKRECIEESLYGVDIDPGAVEIAKLRLWLSLVVDEEDIKQIKPLPNLDYKIVCGNSLLGYPYTPQGLEQIEKLKDMFFNEVNPTRKRSLRDEINHAIYDLYKGTEKNLGYEVTMDFRINFSEVFREKGGFDVVIANPPYGAELSQLEKKIFDKEFYRYKSPNKNSAIYFTYKANKLVNRNGIHSFIVPKSLCYSWGWNRCAQLVIDGLIKLIDIGKAFEQVLLEQVVFIRTPQNELPAYMNGLYRETRIEEYEGISKKIFEKYNVLLSGQTSNEIKIIKKIVNKCSNTFGSYVSIERGLNWQGKVRENLGKTPIYRGAQLYPYLLGKATDYVDLPKFGKNEYEYLLKPKILNQLAIAHVQNPYPHFYLQAALDLENQIVFETISCTFVKNPSLNIKFLLALNNSRLFAWLLYKFIYSNAIRSTRYDEQYVGRVPCPKFEIINQKLFIEFVDKILAITRDEDYLQSEEKQAKVKEYEHQVDQMVYRLYELTDEEIKIVEGADK